VQSDNEDFLCASGSLFAIFTSPPRDENGSDTDGYCGYIYKKFSFLGLNSQIEYGYGQYILCQIVIFIIFGS
jgi:hypothetical protein